MADVALPPALGAAALIRDDEVPCKPGAVRGRHFQKTQAGIGVPRHAKYPFWRLCWACAQFFVRSV